MSEERIIAAEEKEDDKNLDLTLRPKQLKEYVGQEKIKANLNIFMQAAKKRKEPIEHVLLHGSPGLGKTTLAHVIAHEMKSSIRITSGPAIERAGDLAAIITNLSDGDILFIDEIHRLQRTVEEVLYPAMEEFVIDMVVGKGPSAQTIRLDLPHFTLIGATTRVSSVSSPLRDRFGAVFHLDYYADEDIEKIIKRAATILKVGIDQRASKEIARRARKTPRVANRLLKRVRDYAQVKADGRITAELAHSALEMLDIDIKGLDAVDRKILEVMIDRYQGGPVGVNSIAASAGQEIATIEDVYEPFLLQIGFLARTPRGRVVTDKAYEHLGLTKSQNKLV
ncbi:Holliday junction branch migration DNA helicase RuvB [Patescibacteria group bacterium]|nr:Holliday junction branch migration DNA helicase RuvB [Patescibacteria group bacterium]